jgi:hypothetical protein
LLVLSCVQYAPLAKETLGVTLQSRDEIDCLVKGMAFVIGYVIGEVFTYQGRCVAAHYPVQEHARVHGIQYH